MSNDVKLYSTPEVARILEMDAAYIRVLLSRYPELAPKLKIGNSWIWTEEEVERLRARPKGRRPE